MVFSQYVGDGARSRLPLEVMRWTLEFFLILAVSRILRRRWPASMRVKQDTTDDYLAAGRGMHPNRQLCPLSAPGIPDTCSSVLSDSST